MKKMAEVLSLPARALWREAERVLREISSSRPARVSTHAPDRLTLDPGLDFVLHDDGLIELTEAGFRRMGQAHSAGLDTVIETGRHDVFRFSATKFGGACRIGSVR